MLYSWRRHWLYGDFTHLGQQHDRPPAPAPALRGALRRTLRRRDGVALAEEVKEEKEVLRARARHQRFIQEEVPALSRRSLFFILKKVTRNAKRKFNCTYN